MNTNEEDREIDFLKRLTKLTQETGIEIRGCGCCGSPFLSPLTEKEHHERSKYIYEEKVCWIYPGSLEWGKNELREVAHRLGLYNFNVRDLHSKIWLEEITFIEAVEIMTNQAFLNKGITHSFHITKNFIKNGEIKQ